MEIRYQLNGVWSDWMEMDEWVTGLENLSAVEVNTTMTKQEFKEHFPEMYHKHFHD